MLKILKELWEGYKELRAMLRNPPPEKETPGKMVDRHDAYPLSSGPRPPVTLTKALEHDSVKESVVTMLWYVKDRLTPDDNLEFSVGTFKANPRQKGFVVAQFRAPRLDWAIDVLEIHPYTTRVVVNDDGKSQLHSIRALAAAVGFDLTEFYLNSIHPR